MICYGHIVDKRTNTSQSMNECLFWPNCRVIVEESSTTVDSSSVCVAKQLWTVCLLWISVQGFPSQRERALNISKHYSQYSQRPWGPLGLKFDNSSHWHFYKFCKSATISTVMGERVLLLIKQQFKLRKSSLTFTERKRMKTERKNRETFSI